MSEDDINKIQTIFGYLQPLYDGLDMLKRMGAWQFLPGLIEEAEEWVNGLVALDIPNHIEGKASRPQTLLTRSCDE